MHKRVKETQRGTVSDVVHDRPAVPVLSLQHVTKQFEAKLAVNDLELQVPAREIFGFLGPNGAGKSTTIKLILDLLRPTSGTIELFGVSNRRVVETHRRIGYLSGDMVLDADLTGRQYLSFAARTYGRDCRTRIMELASRLQADLDVKFANYSRGSRQKIGLIAAMMHQPELLILDEPSSGFDPLMQETFIRLVEEYRQAGGTVFISSHTLDEVQRLCDRVGFIRAGRLVGIAGIDELNRTSGKQVRVAATVSELVKLSVQASQLAGLKLTEQLPSRCTFSYGGAARPLLEFLAHYELSDVTIEEPELEAIFMSYYQNDAPTDDA